jgi:H+-transporting ATPase
MIFFKETKGEPPPQVFGLFLGTHPRMIEIAAILSFAVRHWADFIIMVLLLFNAVIGFWEENQASNAL